VNHCKLFYNKRAKNISANVGMIINELQVIFLQIIHNTGRMENNQGIREADWFSPMLLPL
jgi:hypothetical protein